MKKDVEKAFEKKKMKNRLGIFLFIIGIFSFFIFQIGLEKVVVGEKLCVDGNGDINLEGLMCEETEELWFGLPRVVGSIIAFVGLFLFLNSLFIFIGWDR